MLPLSGGGLDFGAFLIVSGSGSDADSSMFIKTLFSCMNLTSMPVGLDIVLDRCYGQCRKFLSWG